MMDYLKSLILLSPGNFLACWVWGGQPKTFLILTIITFLLEHSFMLKSYGVGGWVAHKILLSAPVPWIGDLGLGDWD